MLYKLYRVIRNHRYDGTMAVIDPPLKPKGKELVLPDSTFRRKKTVNDVGVDPRKLLSTSHHVGGC